MATIYNPIDIQQTEKWASVHFPIVELNSVVVNLNAITANIAGNMNDATSAPSIFLLPVFEKVIACRIYNDLRGVAVIDNTVGAPSPVNNALQYISHENTTELNGVARRCNYTARQNYTDASIRNLSKIVIYDTLFRYGISAVDISPNAIFSPNLAVSNFVRGDMKVRVEYTFE